MTDKKIFVHIGSPKTGTSSLQTFLVNKRKALEKHGIIYPVSCMHSNQHYFLPLVGTQNSHEADKAWLQLEQELSEKEWNTTLLSSERFFSVEPDKILAPCSKLCNNSHIVLFLREREQLIMSCYKTAIRARLMLACTPHVFFPMFVENLRKLDYDFMVKRWIDSFGREKVHLLSYEYALAKDNTVKTYCDLVRENGVALPEFSDSDYDLKIHETPPDLVLDLLLRTNQFDYGMAPYEQIVEELVRIAAQAEIDRGKTTSAMQVSEKGLALLQSYNEQWSHEYISMYPEHVAKNYQQFVTPVSAKEEWTEDERIKAQIKLLLTLPDKFKQELEKGTKKSLEEIPGIPVIDDLLEHYKTLYRRNTAQLRRYKDRETFSSSEGKNGNKTSRAGLRKFLRF